MDQNITLILRQAQADRAEYLRSFFARLFNRKIVAGEVSHS